MRKFIFFMLAAALLALSGCVVSGRGSVRGQGDRITYTLDAADFTGLHIIGGYDLSFRQSDDFSVTLQIQENLYRHVETRVQNGVLRVHSTRNFNTSSGNTPHLIISAPSLHSLNVEGAVDAGIDVSTDRLEVVVAGAASIRLSGSADTLSLNVSGASDVDAFDMEANDVTVVLAGAGDVDVHAVATLNVRIDGVGRVRYDGDPQVTRNISGLGTVTKRN